MAMALPISPSQDFKGNDGPWSTFAVQVGSNGDVVLLLPATGISGTWVVNPAGCASQDLSSCPDLRGRTFDPNTTKTTFIGNPGQAYKLPFGTELPLIDNTTNFGGGGAYVGLDELALGTEGNDTPRLANQLVASYGSKLPFLGQLGLKNQTIEVTSYKDIHPSMLGTLAIENAIASTMWAYTAGSFNRSAFASLTLGGYDEVRGNVEGVLTSKLSATSVRDLRLKLTDIQIESNSVSGLSDSMEYFIDSLVPEIWLPTPICDQFESKFDLTWDPTFQAYFVSPEAHERNLATAQSVSFALEDLDGQTSTTITMPYADLDLAAQWPMFGIKDSDTTSRYFAIKRAANSSQFVFGRAFLQDAYLAVNYDTRTFNISQALFPDQTSDSSIITVVSRDATSSKGKSGLSSGAIAGIVVGVIAALVIAGGLAFWYLRRKNRQKRRMKPAKMRSSSIDGTTINGAGDEIIPYQPMFVEEHYAKPPVDGPYEVDGEIQDKFKREELDGQEAQRAELFGSTVRRISDQSRPSISPLDERTRSRSGYRSGSFGSPSPPLSDRPTPPLGQESPPLGSGMQSWIGPFELPSHSRSRHFRQPSAMSSESRITEEGTPRPPVSPPERPTSPAGEEGTFVSALDSTEHVDRGLGYTSGPVEPFFSSTSGFTRTATTTSTTRQSRFVEGDTNARDFTDLTAVSLLPGVSDSMAAQSRPADANDGASSALSASAGPREVETAASEQRVSGDAELRSDEASQATGGQVSQGDGNRTHAAEPVVSP